MITQTIFKCVPEIDHVTHKTIEDQIQTIINLKWIIKQVFTFRNELYVLAERKI